MTATGEPRWLGDDEQHSWRALMMGITLLLERLDDDLRREFSMSLGEYEILVRLSERPGRAMRMTQLADAATSSKSRLSHAVARLEERGWVSPGMFIPVAEDSSLIGPLGDWALNRACADAAAWPDTVRVAVNVSARQVTPALADVVQQTRARHGIDDHALVLELTESILLDDAPEPTAVLNQLQMANVRLHLDDFGTGFSALSYLSRIPLSALKIDQSFVKAMRDNRSDLVMVQSTIALAHSLGRTVVAEGVESREVLDLLVAMKCDFAQGFIIGRPSSFEGLTRRLFARKGRHVA